MEMNLVPSSGRKEEVLVDFLLLDLSTEAENLTVGEDMTETKVRVVVGERLKEVLGAIQHKVT